MARVRDRLAHSPVAIGQRPMLRQLLIFAATGAVPTEHKLKRAALSDMKAVQQYLTPPKGNCCWEFGVYCQRFGTKVRG